MPTYRITIQRGARFQLDLDAATRLDALRMINTTATEHDGIDQKETRVISIKELKQADVHHSIN